MVARPQPAGYDRTRRRKGRGDRRRTRRVGCEQVPREVLLRFVSELPEGYRAVFNLYCIEEYSHREIARMLGINEKSSSSQLFRARALLARKIRAYLESH